MDRLDERHVEPEEASIAFVERGVIPVDAGEPGEVAEEQALPQVVEDLSGCGSDRGDIEVGEDLSVAKGPPGIAPIEGLGTVDLATNDICVGCEPDVGTGVGAEHQ